MPPSRHHEPSMKKWALPPTASTPRVDYIGTHLASLLFAVSVWARFIWKEEVDRMGRRLARFYGLEYPQLDSPESTP